MGRNAAVMLRTLALASSLLLIAGCALRPRYGDFVSPTTPPGEITFLLAEKASGAPLAGVPVEMGEGKAKVRVTTADDGTFTLPVDAKLAADNPIIAVALPRGVSGYTLAVAPTKAVTMPAEAPAPTTTDVEASPPVEAPAPEAAPVEEVGAPASE